MKPNGYTEQSGCHNCEHRFEKDDYDDPTEYFCAFDAPMRPLCGSVSMEECFDDGATPIDDWLKQNGYADQPIESWHDQYNAYHDLIWMPAYFAWEEWSKNRRVHPWGICNQFKEE